MSWFELEGCLTCSDVVPEGAVIICWLAGVVSPENVFVDERKGENGLLGMYGKNFRRGTAGGAVGGEVAVSSAAAYGVSFEAVAGGAAASAIVMAANGRTNFVGFVQNICGDHTLITAEY